MVGALLLVACGQDEAANTAVPPVKPPTLAPPAASTGKNAVRIELTKFEGRYTARVSNFATGFKHPLPIIVAPDGSLLIGDNGAGTILRVSYTGS